MKKILFTLIVSLSALSGALAQTGNNATPRIAIGFVYGGATGPSADNYNYASGFVLKYQMPLKSSPVNITFTTGYDFFIPQTRYVAYINPGNGGGPRISYAQAAFIPLEVGARFYLVKKLYFEGDAGVSVNVNSHHEYYTNKTVAPVVSPNLGYAFRFGNAEKYGLDVDFGYEGRFESNSNRQYYQGSYGRLALSTAFSFGL
jgi:hypothetical protein